MKSEDLAPNLRPQEAIAHSVEASQDEKGEFKYVYMIDEHQRELLAERIMNVVEKANKEDMRNVVFLDKSARPLHTLFTDLWKQAYPNEEPPSISFLNVGSETAEKDRSRYYGGYTDEDMSVGEIKSHVGAGEIERIRREYKYLSDANRKSESALIIDEFMNTGRSLVWAKRVLETSFPNIHFEDLAIAHPVPRKDRKEKKSLFESDTGNFNHAPWAQLNKGSQLYGATGVVESQANRLTAEPSRKISGEERKSAQIRYYEGLRGTIETKIESCKEDLKREQANLAELKSKLFSFSEEIRDYVSESQLIQHLERSIDSKSQFLAHAEENDWGSAARDINNITELSKNQGEDILDLYDKQLDQLGKAFSRTQQGSEESKKLLPKFHEFIEFGGFNPHPREILPYEEIFKLHSEIASFDPDEPANKPPIKQLREEMHMIAKEYWEKRQKEAK